jgi:ribosomal protein S18 acetylase RimI-like enzyme
LPSLTLRRAVEGDRGLLLEIYASTRAEELAPLPWDEAAKRAFLTQQFDAQDSYYREHRPDAAYDVIIVDGRPGGRLYVDRGPDQILVMDIALLPEFRNRGIGTMLLRSLIDEADASVRTLSIHIEMNNPARSLYDRLGFRPAGEHGVYVLMERPPASS